MTKKDLKDFCIENAGKIASGRYRGITPTKIVKGRILAFVVDQFNQALILLEDPKGKDNADLPNPLPTIPYTSKGWQRVVSPSKMGFPVYAESVVVEAAVSDQNSAPVKAVTTDVATHIPDTEPTVCMHTSCDPTWCHLKYVGLI